MSGRLAGRAASEVRPACLSGLGCRVGGWGWGLGGGVTLTKPMPARKGHTKWTKGLGLG